MSRKNWDSCRSFWDPYRNFFRWRGILRRSRMDVPWCRTCPAQRKCFLSATKTCLAWWKNSKNSAHPAKPQASCWHGNGIPGRTTGRAHCRRIREWPHLLSHENHQEPANSRTQQWQSFSRTPSKSLPAPPLGTRQEYLRDEAANALGEIPYWCAMCCGFWLPNFTGIPNTEWQWSAYFRR